MWLAKMNRVLLLCLAICHVIESTPTQSLTSEIATKTKSKSNEFVKLPTLYSRSTGDSDNAGVGVPPQTGHEENKVSQTVMNSMTMQTIQYNGTRRVRRRISKDKTEGSIMKRKDSNSLTEKFKNVLMFDQSSSLTKGGRCKMRLSNASLTLFSHRVAQTEYNYVFLGLMANKRQNITINSSPKVINGNIWIWTYFGPDGGKEFLKWPIEFGIWSMGILFETVLRNPVVINMMLERVAGDCSNLTVGVRKDDKAISDALKVISKKLDEHEKYERYAASYYCYTRTIDIPPYMRAICENIICPFEAIKNACCMNRFNQTTLERNIICPEYSFRYETVSWAVPIFLAIVLFIYCPIALFYIAHVVFDDSTYKYKRLCESSTSINDRSLDMVASDINECRKEMFLFEGYSHVTFFKTLAYPFMCLFSRMSKTPHFSIFALILFRIPRISLPLLTLVPIFIQFYIDFTNLHNYIKTAISLKVPFGFRSIVVGYNLSKENFLPYFGGPIVALECYLLVTCVLLVIPNSVADCLVSGAKAREMRIHGRANEDSSPLTISLTNIERFGSVKHLRRSTGFCVLFKLLLAHMLMMFNAKFWLYAVEIQSRRWCRFASRSTNRCWVALFPCYVICCFLELLVSSIFYGLPIFGFGWLVLRSYVNAISSRSGRHTCVRVAVLIVDIVTTVAVLYFLFMFCLVFLESIVFMTRISIFSYTAVILVPKTAYGYFIFYFTILYYLWDAVHNYTLTYTKLFNDSVKASEIIQNSERISGVLLVQTFKGRKGIPKALYELIIEEHRPRRRQMFITCIRLAIVLMLVSISVEVLIKTDKFRELDTIMHVSTAVFVCAMPLIFKKLCKKRESKLKQLQYRKGLKKSIMKYSGYFVEQNESSSSDSE